jgi:hypothetical protein
LFSRSGKAAGYKRPKRKVGGETGEPGVFDQCDPIRSTKDDIRAAPLIAISVQGSNIVSTPCSREYLRWTGGVQKGLILQCQHEHFMCTSVSLLVIAEHLLPLVPYARQCGPLVVEFSVSHGLLIDIFFALSKRTRTPASNLHTCPAC